MGYNSRGGAEEDQPEAGDMTRPHQENSSLGPYVEESSVKIRTWPLIVGTGSAYTLLFSLYYTLKQSAPALRYAIDPITPLFLLWAGMPLAAAGTIIVDKVADYLGL